MPRHTSITLDRIVRMVKRDAMQGICGGCGKTVSNVEPDAERYPCPKCKAPRVYGAEQWLLMTQA